MVVNFQNAPHAGIRSLIPYKPGKSIEELAKEKGLSDIIKMASNENALGCSPRALTAIHSISAQTIATYPSPNHHPLMERLAEHLKIERDKLFVSNGSDFIYGLLLNAFALHQKGHVLTHEYAFSTYAIQAKSLNIAIKHSPVQEDFEVDIAKLINNCNEETRIIFLANPNNPTGLLISSEKIQQLLEGIPEKTLVVIDEAYYEYAQSEYSFNSINYLEKYPNLIITRTFSKIYGLAGLRLGYAIAHPDIITILQRLQLPFTVNQVALNAALAALDDNAFIQQSLEMTSFGMQQLQEGFQKLKVQYLPSACNFLTFNCQEDGNFLYNYLLDEGIIVRPLHPYKMDNYLRVSIGTKTQNERFLNALHDYKLRNTDEQFTKQAL